MIKKIITKFITILGSFKITPYLILLLFISVGVLVYVIKITNIAEKPVHTEISESTPEKIEILDNTSKEPINEDLLVLHNWLIKNKFEKEKSKELKECARACFPGKFYFWKCIESLDCVKCLDECLKKHNLEEYGIDRDTALEVLRY